MSLRSTRTSRRVLALLCITALLLSPHRSSQVRAAPLAGPQQTQTMGATVPTPQAHFGNAVAIDDSFAVVGAEADSATGTERGSITIFRLNNGQWETGPTFYGELDHSFFGHAVAISGSTIVVGAYRHNPGFYSPPSGAAYVFRLNGTNWLDAASWQRTPLLPDVPSQAGNFGNAVAISGDTIAVSQLGIADDSGSLNNGAVTIYDRVGTDWAPEPVKVRPHAGAQATHFGESIALETHTQDPDDPMADTLVVGAPEETTLPGSAISRDGAVHVFTRTGSNWAEQPRLVDPDQPITNGGFGRAVALESGVIAVGEAGWNMNTPIDTVSGGFVHIFLYREGSWRHTSRLLSPDPYPQSANFGWSVALSGGTLLVGDPADAGNGAAFIFTFNGLSFNYSATLAPTMDSVSTYGWAVAFLRDPLQPHADAFVGMPQTANQGVASAGLVDAVDVALPFNGNVVTQLIVETVHGIDPDVIEGPTQGNPDFYAKITVNGQSHQTKPKDGMNDLRLTDWFGEATVDLATTTDIAANLQLWDDDGFLGLDFGDDQIDINPQPGLRDINLDIDLLTCAITGDLGDTPDPTCAGLLKGQGDEAKKAEITYRVHRQPPTSELRGVVLDRLGSPFGGLKVALVDNLTSKTIAIDETTEQGEFSFEHKVLPGRVMRVELAECPVCAVQHVTAGYGGIRPVIRNGNTLLPPCSPPQCGYAPLTLRLSTPLASDRPQIDQVTPNQMLTAVLKPITIEGHNFHSGASVLINGFPVASAQRQSSTTILATLPSGLKAGSYALTVVNPDSLRMTLPTAIQLIDPQIAFTPKLDGYRFANDGSGKPEDLTIMSMRDIFGDVICQSFIQGQCQLKKPFEDWWKTQASDIPNGLCYGMAVTSMRLFRELDQPGMFEDQATKTHDLHFDSVRQYLASYQIRQLANPAYQARQDSSSHTPGRILQDLSLALAQNASNVDATLDIWYQPKQEEKPEEWVGHTLTPYAVQSRGDNIFWIQVYDPNFPDSVDRHVIIDATANTWFYDTGQGIWQGGAKSTLDLIEVIKNQPPMQCPTCGSSDSPKSAAITSRGDARILITDSLGHRIGVDSNQEYDEIPGASQRRFVFGIHQSGPISYDLPTDSAYTVRLDGRALTTTTDIDLSQFGPGYAVTVDGGSLVPGHQHQVMIGQDGTTIGYHADSAAEANLTIALDSPPARGALSAAPAASYSLSIQSADIGAGQTVTMTVDTDRGELHFSNALAGGGSYGIDIMRVDATGEHHYQHAIINIGAGASHIIDYAAWDGRGALSVQVDAHSDGSVDQIISADNEVQVLQRVIYLPLMRR